MGNRSGRIFWRIIDGIFAGSRGNAGVVWAMDGTQYDMGLSGKVYLCNMQDLGSRYNSCPWQEEANSVGEQIAEHLGENIDRYGAPLVLKRDNEGTMNHADVNELLKESFVLR